MKLLDNDYLTKNYFIFPNKCEECGKKLKRGESVIRMEGTFTSIICIKCYPGLKKRIEQRWADLEKEKLDKKRADFKILAEEIVKSLKEDIKNDMQ